MNQKKEMKQTETMEIQYGDFFDRCFPKTYQYFVTNNLKQLYDKENYDCFDEFIKDNIPFFSFLIDQYYKNNKKNNLQLLKIADIKYIEHLDHTIFHYVKTKNKKYLNEAKELYIYLLESCLIKYLIPTQVCCMQ